MVFNFPHNIAYSLLLCSITNCIFQYVLFIVILRIIFNGNDYADCDSTNSLDTDTLDMVSPAYAWVLQNGDATNNNITNTDYPTQLDLIGYFSTPTMNYTESALQSSDRNMKPQWHGPLQRYLNIGNYDDSNYKADCSMVGRRVHLRRFDSRSDNYFTFG